MGNFKLILGILKIEIGNYLSSELATLEPGPLRLNTPLAPRPDGLPSKRIVDLDFKRSIDEIVADFPRAERDSNSENHVEHWMRLMKFR